MFCYRNVSLKVLISIGLKVFRRLAIYFPKCKIVYWLQAMKFQEDLEYFKSYLEISQTNKKPTSCTH